MQSRFEAADILKGHFLALSEDEQDAIVTELDLPEWVAMAPSEDSFWSGIRRECGRTDKMADLWDMVETRTRDGRPHPNPWL